MLENVGEKEYTHSYFAQYTVNSSTHTEEQLGSVTGHFSFRQGNSKKDVIMEKSSVPAKLGLWHPK